MKDWRIEFPGFPVEDMPTLPEGWVDASWHNDACPSFVNEGLKAAIFVDYRDKSFPSFSTQSVESGLPVGVPSVRF
jgi:hypothetical protein